MDWYEKMKGFFGFSSPRDSQNYVDSSRYPEAPRDEMEPSGTFSFFDPFEMHRMFEQQMGELLQSFGFDDFGGFGSFHVPQIENFEDHIPETKAGDLREQFLKPGVDGPKPQHETNRLNIKDWGSVVDGTPQRVASSHFFGQSVSTKTIRNSDGFIETHRTVRDHAGNEETTITRKVGDKEYSIIKRRDKDGKEEVIENLVNMDENEIDKYFPRNQDRFSNLEQPPEWPFFNRLFK